MGRVPRALVSLALAAVVIAVGVVLVQRVDREPGGGRARTDPVRVTAVAVTSAGAAAVVATGDRLELRVPVRTDAPVTVSLTVDGALPTGLTVPADPLAVDPGATGDLQIRWTGPDCDLDVPARVLPDLTLAVTLPDGTALTSPLDTSGADEALRTNWAVGCGIETTPRSGGS